MTEEEQKSFFGEEAVKRARAYYHKYAPLFDSLYNNKIVYHEGFTRIVRLEDLKVTKQHFQATAISEKVILSRAKQERLKKRNTLQNFYKPRQWSFKCSWVTSTISEEPLRIGSIANFVVWIEPDFVKHIEELVEYEKNDEALQLLWGISKINLADNK